MNVIFQECLREFSTFGTNWLYFDGQRSNNFTYLQTCLVHFDKQCPADQAKAGIQTQERCENPVHFQNEKKPCSDNWLDITSKQTIKETRRGVKPCCGWSQASSQLDSSTSVLVESGIKPVCAAQCITVLLFLHLCKRMQDFIVMFVWTGAHFEPFFTATNDSYSCRCICWISSPLLWFFFLVKILKKIVKHAVTITQSSKWHFHSACSVSPSLTVLAENVLNICPSLVLDLLKL